MVPAGASAAAAVLAAGFDSIRETPVDERERGRWREVPDGFPVHLWLQEQARAGHRQGQPRVLLQAGLGQAVLGKGDPEQLGLR